MELTFCPMSTCAEITVTNTTSYSSRALQCHVSSRRLRAKHLKHRTALGRYANAPHIDTLESYAERVELGSSQNHTHKYLKLRQTPTLLS